MTNFDRHSITEKDLDLLDKIFCSNLGLKDEYIYLAKKLCLRGYLDLYAGSYN